MRLIVVASRLLLSALVCVPASQRWMRAESVLLGLVALPASRSRERSVREEVMSRGRDMSD